MVDNKELREKVANGLECHFLVDVKPCEKCEYYSYKDCTEVLAKDAISLIKYKEPRILGLNELKEGMTVWLERAQLVKVHPVEITSIKAGMNYFDQKIMKVKFSEPWSEECTDIPPGDRYEDYNVSWRCWDDKPSDELRRSTRMGCYDESDDEYEEFLKICKEKSVANARH